MWLNLPARNKMAPPHFTMFWGEDIPQVDEADGVSVKVIAGRYGDAVPLAPPPDSWAAQPESEVAVWLVRIPAGARWNLPAGAAGLSRSLHVLSGGPVDIDGHALPGRHTAQLRSGLALAVRNDSALAAPARERSGGSRAAHQAVTRL